MINTNPSASGSSRPTLGFGPLLAGALAAGLASGAFGAYAYYHDPLRPVAHTFSLWLVVVIGVAAGRPARRAVPAGVAALVAAVVAFYVGKKVMYGIRYPGMPYPLDVEQILLWCVLAVVAGAALGWAFSWIGAPGWPGAAAAAGAVGLLVADVGHRVLNYGVDVAPLVVAALGVLLVALRVAPAARAQWTRTALLVAPSALLAYVLVSAPDMIEGVTLFG